MSKVLGSQSHIGGIQRDYSYDIIRVTLVALVVLGHSDFYQIKTAFGGIYLADAMKLQGVQDTQLHGYIRMLSALIYSFHMPAFMALSGALYQKHFSKYKSFMDLITEKARNLLLPYLIVWIFWNIPIKYLAGYYKGIPVWKWVVQIAVPYDVYLWFLLSLFIVFVLSFAIDRLKNISCIKRLAFVFVAFIFSLLCQRLMGMYMPLGNPLKYFLWFEMGRQLEERKEGHRGIENSSKSYLVIGTSVIILLTAFYISQHISHFGWVIRDTICPFAGLLFMWIIANNFAVRLSDGKKRKLLRMTSYSMGLFLYAEPINYLVLSMVERTLGIEFFGLNIGTVTVFFGRIVISVFMALIISGVMKKTKINIRLY